MKTNTRCERSGQAIRTPIPPMWERVDGVKCESCGQMVGMRISPTGKGLYEPHNR